MQEQPKTAVASPKRALLAWLRAATASMIRVGKSADRDDDHMRIAPYAGSFRQRRNAQANARRKAKRVIGARQLRKREKALRRAAKAAS